MNDTVEKKAQLTEEKSVGCALVLFVKLEWITYHTYAIAAFKENYIKIDRIFCLFLSWLYSVNLAVGFRGLNNLLRNILRGFFVAHEIEREATSALRDLAHIGAEIVHFGHCTSASTV